MDSITVPGLRGIAHLLRWVRCARAEVSIHAEARSGIMPRASYSARISSSPMGAYGPSLHSRITVPLSKARAVCHWPGGMLRATTGPLDEISMASVQIHYSSS